MPPGQYDQPKPDELEISLFGPGYGECILVHYGNGNWLTVDSCLAEDRETPSALAYLSELGLEPAQCVTHCVMTHPDGDHIGGLSKLVEACQPATLVCPAILSHGEMLHYVALHAGTDTTPLTRGSNEIVQALKVTEQGRGNPLSFAKQDTLIVNADGIRITALSPSDERIKHFLTWITMNTPKVKSDRGAPGKLLPNDVSMALLFESEQFTAIFGADLEEARGDGWATVLNSSVAFGGSAPAKTFKIAHHGSANADCPDLWKSMDEPIAILAPFQRGRHQIPNVEDVARILTYTDDAFSTARHKSRKVKSLSRADKTMVQHGIRRRELQARCGHIRIRVSDSGERRVKLFEGAVPLSKVH